MKENAGENMTMALLTMIKPTRGELLRLRRRIALAKRGHELLKKKQDALVIEFFRLLKETMAHRAQLQAAYAGAVQRLDEARALESDLRIEAAALSVRENAAIAIEIRSVAGVKVPSITITERDKDRPAYDSIMLQDVGYSYRDVVERLLGIAAKETALRKILVEIRKTKRRAQALEHVLIPQLEAAREHIRFELEERERESFARLKHRHAA